MLRILEALDECGIRYMVVGGFAMVLYGIPRTTVDIDLMLDLSEENLRKFLQCMAALGLKFRQPVRLEDVLNPRWRQRISREKGALVLTLHNPDNPLEEVDFFIKNPIDFEEAYRRRRVLKGDSLRVSVVHPEDLIRMKEMAGREGDFADIELLRRLMDEEES